jgi:hypothetical protein
VELLLLNPCGFIRIRPETRNDTHTCDFPPSFHMMPVVLGTLLAMSPSPDAASDCEPPEL